MQRMVDGFDVVEDMALCNQQVFPAIVINVFQADSPARAARGERTQAGFETSIRKYALAIVVVNAVDFTRQYSHEDVSEPIVIIVLKNGAHPGKRLAISG